MKHISRWMKLASGMAAPLLMAGCHAEVKSDSDARLDAGQGGAAVESPDSKKDVQISGQNQEQETAVTQENASQDDPEPVPEEYRGIQKQDREHEVQPLIYGPPSMMGRD